MDKNLLLDEKDAFFFFLQKSFLFIPQNIT